MGGAALISQWFAGFELSFAFGTSISIARIGSVVNNLISPRIADADGLDIALWFGCVLAGGILLGALAIYPLDKGMEVVLRASEKLRVQEGYRRSLLEPGEEIVLEGGVLESDASSHSLCCTDTLGSGIDSTLGASDKSGEEANGVSNRKSDKGAVDVGGARSEVVDSADQPTVSDLSGSHQQSKEEDETRREVKFSDVLRFPLVYWCIALSCVLMYGCIFPFNNIASTLLLERNYFMKQPDSQCALEDPAAPCESTDNQPNIHCDNGEWYQPPLALGAQVDCSDDPGGCYSNYCDGEAHAEVYAAMVMSIPYSIAVCLVSACVANCLHTCVLPYHTLPYHVCAGL